MIPVKGMPIYTARPKAAIVPRIEDTTPKKPSRGLDLTQSVIMQVRTQKAIMIPTFRVKKGRTELVLFSSSTSRVRELNRRTSTSGGALSFTFFKNSASHLEPL